MPMSGIASWVLFSLYCLVAGALFAYALNCYLLLWLFWRRAAGQRRPRQPVMPTCNWPFVTTQIPVYNEVNVVERVITAAAALTYPVGRHQIQVLDDSDDETALLIDRRAAELRANGCDIAVIRRPQRDGFKAGALAAGLHQAQGELIAMFDADFVPEPDFLERVVPHFLSNPQLGLVQARWGHLNHRRSWLTRIQALGIDGHFMIEQPARAWNSLYLNFNGTAGIWRRAAIDDGGGWQADTLTEDMDLSYRAQLQGWQAEYLLDVVVPGEIPENVLAFRSQQFRWAKGSMQTAMKLLPAIFAAPGGRFRKLQAFMHLTHYAIHPLMLVLALLALPVLVTAPIVLPWPLFAVVGVMLLVSMSAPSAMYIVAQRTVYDDWLSRLCALPLLVCVGVGLALANTRAVCEAWYGKRSPFVRTPKRGRRQRRQYRSQLPRGVWLELLTGAYCLVSFAVYIERGSWWIGPFLLVYGVGFLLLGGLSLLHAVPRQRHDGGPELTAAAAPESA